MIRKLTILAALGGAALLLPLAAAAAQQPVSDPAVSFGTRQGVESISLSPDGRQIAFVVPDKARGNALYTVPVDASKPPLRILLASGDPESIGGCEWVSNARLLCRVIIVTRYENLVPVVGSRLIAVDSVGGNVKVVSKREGQDALYRAFSGGTVVDYLSGEDGVVLLGRVYVPEERVGTNVSRSLVGLGVDRVNTLTLDSKRIETPRKDAVEFIADGKGQVRLMGLNPSYDSGYSTDKVNYLYRLPGSDDWKPFGQYAALAKTGFNPYAVDAAQNVVYGFDNKGGRLGLYKVTLDEARTETPVLLHPQVDVDDLLQLGRSRRVVGASYVTERRTPVYFDPELKALSASLSKALPGSPLIYFAGASSDEKKLLVWAGGDTDAGHYYLLDRTTKQMQRLLASRPELDSLQLATVKAVSYKAADGTQIPAYLTLPPGSDGKNVPAIVMPHGGPAARDEWGFDWLAQYFAARGYAVLQPNFRGSSGYGDAWFKNNGFQSWRSAIGDVSDGGRWLVSQGIADPKKMAIVGWSYGGYAALQSAAVSPDLFKAVVAIAPVTDFAKLREDALDYANGRITRDYIGSGPHIREGSPAQNASAIKAPVLMFHGTLDSNVPIVQSTMMKDRLRDSGKTADVVVYQGLDHQLDDSTARADMLRRADQFLRTSMGM
jgi:dipeptidyl aminopeptidase/acylaminoacyl peptidase